MKSMIKVTLCAVALGSFSIAISRAASIAPILPTDINPTGFVAGIDFDDNSPTQAGFLGIPASNNKAYNVTHNGITFDIVVTNANLNNQNRDRGTAGDLIRDFEQWYGNTGTAIEFTLTLSGLDPSTDYDISVWHLNQGAGHNTLNFHNGSSSGFPLIGSSTTSGNSGNLETLQSGSTLTMTSDVSGEIVLTAVGSTADARVNINGIGVTYIGPSVPQQPLEFTEIDFDQVQDEITLTWKSNVGEVYGLYWSEDLQNFEANIDPEVPAASEGIRTTVGPFANPAPGASRLFFRLSDPDFNDPALTNVSGNNSTITIQFSEPMATVPASEISNYIVTPDGGSPISLSSVEFGEDGRTATLTTAAPMGLGTTFTVSFQNMTDKAGRALPPGATDTFATWDNNPNGVKVFILAGQSNMQGQGWHDDSTDNGIDEDGTIRKMIENDAGGTYDYLLDGNSDWVTRSDVHVYTVDGDRTGALTVGYGVNSTRTGAEYGFGWKVGDLITEDVLIIKTCWGGKSLMTDFRPPSAVEKRGGEVGFYYQEILTVAADVLENIGNYVPGYAGQGYQIAGFGWHQGWNDRVNSTAVAEYEENLVDFINDIRFDLSYPDLPFVVANTGIGGLSESNTNALALMQAQLNVGNDTLYPEFADNVVSIETRPFWREANVSPITSGGQGYHWNQNGETMFLIGDAMGEGMVDLIAAP
jgi:hypothetical protein